MMRSAAQHDGDGGTACVGVAGGDKHLGELGRRYRHHHLRGVSEILRECRSPIIWTG
jgi:hypothetical protein